MTATGIKTDVAMKAGLCEPVPAVHKAGGFLIPYWKCVAGQTHSVSSGITISERLPYVRMTILFHRSQQCKIAGVQRRGYAEQETLNM